MCARIWTCEGPLLGPLEALLCLTIKIGPLLDKFLSFFLISGKNAVILKRKEEV